MAHAGVVSYVPTNPGWECEGMVREPLARKHRRMGGTQAAVYNQIFNKKSMFQRSNGNNQDCEKGQRNPRGFQGKMDRRNRLYHGCPGGHEDIIVHGRSQMPRTG
ncbi:hypothetical protein Tco_0556085 [Tanacetum coccineum]